MFTWWQESQTLEALWTYWCGRWRLWLLATSIAEPLIPSWETTTAGAALLQSQEDHPPPAPASTVLWANISLTFSI